MDIPINIDTVLAVRKLLGIVNRTNYTGRSVAKKRLAEKAVEDMRAHLDDAAVQRHLRIFDEAAVRARVFKVEKEKRPEPDPKHVERQKEILAVLEQIDKEHREWLDNTAIDSDKHFKSEEALMEKLYAFNDLAADEGIPLGRIHEEGRGDGYALYVCTGGNEKGELYMTHVNFGDAWTSPMIEQRGGWAHPDTLRFRRHSRDSLFGRSRRVAI